jgi:hypothetical protein
VLDTISNVVGNIDLAILHKVQEVFEEEGLVVGLFNVGVDLTMTFSFSYMAV